ncbi:MAG: SprB repeat-containing protein, partial [Deltaproteobacteria bacterium]|nr:SprB repeat-containing protein [Deltaproteobacteria bacterium]
WSNGATSEDLTSLSAGTYTVTVEDANGNQLILSNTLTEPSALNVSIQATDVSVCGGSDGAANASAFGGTSLYEYYWSNGVTTFGATTTSISGLAVGIYTVTVLDSSSCQTVSSVTIDEPTDFNSTITQTDITCNGGNDGSIDLTVSGGTQPYFYSWTNGTTSEDLNSLSAGAYTVTITNGTGCKAIRSGTLGEPDPLILSLSQTDISCFSMQDGFVNAIVTGGTTPYYYTWNTSDTTQIISDLSIGTYSVTVYDDNFCVDLIDSVIINEPLEVIGGNDTVEYCKTQSDIVFLGGAPSGGIWTGSSNVAMVGTDSLNVDATPWTFMSMLHSLYYTYQGCTDTIKLKITGAKAPSDTIVCDGSLLTLSIGKPSGGTWTGQGMIDSNLGIVDISGLSGTEEYVYTKEGCPDTMQVIFSNIQIVATIQNASCADSSDGSISVSVSGGITPYIYDWFSGATSNDISSINAGNYTLTITDNNDCKTTSSYAVSEPPALTISTSTTDVTVCGGSDGTAIASASGGTTPYEYTWSTGATTTSISGLPIGIYQVSILDSHFCQNTASVTINEPNNFTVSSSQSNVSCFGDSAGAINLTISGGTSPFTYFWSNGSTTQNLTTLSVGTYTVSITDSSDCGTVVGITIDGPNELIITPSYSDISCFGLVDGFAAVAGSGGVSPYFYLWSTLDTVQVIIGLSQGSYTVTLTDSDGCIKISTIPIGEPVNLTGSTSGSNVRCNGNNDGIIDLTVSGGTPGYVYSWSNGATSQDITSIIAGNYTVTIRDINNCQTTAIHTISEPPILSVSISKTDVTSCGGSDGTADAVASGGTTPYEYSWSNGVTTSNISGLIIGIYEVNILDINSCQISGSITIDELATYSVTSSQSDVNCNGNIDGSIDLTITGTTTPFLFSWSNGATTDDITSLALGTYTITITDSTGCKAIRSFSIDEPSVLVLNTTENDISCFGSNNGSIITSISGGTSPYSYGWSSGATSSDISDLNAGVYGLTVRDANDCQIVSQDSILEPSALVLSSGKTDITMPGATDGTVGVTVSGGSLPFTYSWSNGGTAPYLAGLALGVYTATVTDANNCTGIITATVAWPESLIVSLIGIDVGCNGGSDGTAEVSIIGGVPPFVYSWSTGATTEDLSGLFPGVYTVTITDADTSVTILRDTINEPTILSSSDIKTDVSVCGGTDGSASAIVSGGTTPYGYNWSNSSTTASISSLATGIYRVTVSDANGCQDVTSINVDEPALYSVNITQTDVSCGGTGDGSIDLTTSGTTIPFTYSWSNGVTTEDLTSISGGTYTVTVTDSTG